MGVADWPRATFAFGICLQLTTTAEGGRRTPLLGGTDPEYRLNYRPNWGLPGMTPPEQTGAPVFGFSRKNIAPGDRCHAVIVAFFPDLVQRWASVGAGVELPMYESSHVCGVGRVLWRAATELPLPAADEDRFFLGFEKVDCWRGTGLVIPLRHDLDRIGSPLVFGFMFDYDE